MDENFRSLAEACTHGSDADRLTFPEVVARLMAGGVERYHADLQRAEKTYYLPDGASHTVAAAPLAAPPARGFSAASVQAAVRAIQAGRLTYGEFCARIASAGCVGYLVSLAGRRVMYYGRTAETYVEPFPPAPRARRAYCPPRPKM